MKTIKSFEGVLNQGHSEDNDQALIFELTEIDENPLDTMFVRVQSWDDQKEHLQIKQFINKKIRITIETIE